MNMIKHERWIIMAVVCLLIFSAFSSFSQNETGRDWVVRFSKEDTSFINLGKISEFQNASEFTIELWFRLEGCDEWGSLFETEGGDVNSGLALAVYQDGLYPCVRNGSNFHHGYKNVLPDSRGIHIAQVFNGGMDANNAIKLYVNGNQVGCSYINDQNAKPVRTPAVLGNFLIGKNVAGQIDEIRLWNKALPADVIKNRWQDPVGADHPFRANLKHYYKFDEKTDGKAKDYTGGLEATLVNTEYKEKFSEISLRSRYDYYTDEKKAELIIDEGAAGAQTAEIYVRGKPAGTCSPVDTKAGSIVEFPLSALSKGENLVKCVLKAGGKVLASGETTVIRLEPKPYGTKIDYASRGIVTGGHQLFPVGLYTYWNENSETILEEEVPYGFTMVSPYWSNMNIPFAEMKPRIKKYLDRCEGLGLKVHYHLMGIVRHSNAQEAFKRLEEEVGAFRTHPAVLGWYLVDEPGQDGTSPAELQSVYDKVKSLDPYRPCTVVFCGTGNVHQYVNGMDIVMGDNYPIVQKDSQPWNVGDFSYEIYRQCGGRKVVWFVPQAFGGGEHWWREPTRSEEIMMTFDSIIRGNATGIQYFVLNSPQGHPKSPEVWAGCRSAAARIFHLQSALLSIEKSPNVTTSLNFVHARSFLDRGILTVIAVNHHNAPASVRISIEGSDLSGRAQVIFENRDVAVSQGAIEDMIDCFGTRVYQIQFGSVPKDLVEPRDNNLVSNFSFENVFSPATPANGYASPGKDRGSSAFLDSRYSVHGRYSVRLATPTRGEGWTFAHFPANLRGGQEYECSFWARTDRPGTRMGALLGSAEKDYHFFELTREWKKYSFTVKCAENARGNFNFTYEGPGIAWIDMTEVGPKQ